MSALGQKQTSDGAQAMSALPPKADKQAKARFVRFVPIATERSAAKKSLLDHIVGAVRDFAWQLRNVHARGCRPYSGLMPADLITLANFSV